jgi:hypothetical protein
MEISTMAIEADITGRSTVKLWCKCHSAQDIDDVIAWLNLARSMMDAWHAQRADADPPPAQSQNAGQ